MDIDLEELERLHKEAAGTPYKAKGDWIYAQSVSHKRTFSRRPMAYTIDNRDGRYKPTETAAYITAACNAVPKLIAKVRDLERQREALAGKVNEYANRSDDIGNCLYCDFSCYCGDSITFCSDAIIRWAEEAAKEAE